ncbi:MAG: hypothetical protein QM482_10730 [Sulfurospirillum sp.]
MKRVFLIILILLGTVYAKSSGDLGLYANVQDNKILLKWIPKKYSSKNVYKIYRKTDGEKEKLLATVKAVPYKDLKKAKYSKDYIFLVYPFKDVKNIDDEIAVAKAEQVAGGFRVLKLLEDNNFAKNLGQFFIDTGVKKSKKYIYRVVLFKNDKKISEASVNANTANKKYLSGIFWMQAKGYEWGVGIKWDSGKESGFYNIYRKLQGEKKFKRLNSTPVYVTPSFAKKSKSFYRDKSLKKNQSASYYVKKVDFFGKEGKPSYSIKAKRLVSQKPKIVQHIFIKNSDKVITLRWRKVPKVIGYNVYRSMNYKGGYKKLNKKPIKKQIYQDKNFKSNQTYYYYVSSLDLRGESKPSMKMLAYARDVTPPPTLKTLQFSVEPGLVKLKWKGVKSDDLLGYRVYMSMDKEAKDWSLITKKAIKNTKFIHKKEKSLSRYPYYYAVVAVDKSFNESRFSNIVKTKLPDVTPPREPKILKFIVYPNRVYLKWDRVLVYDLDHYNVYVRFGKKFQKVNKKPIKINSFEDLNPPKKGKVLYLVTAVDRSGNESAKKSMISIKTVDTTPPVIENFKAVLSKKSIKLSFICRDKDYSGFEVYKSFGNDIRYYKISSFAIGKSFRDRVISKKGSYFYMLKVYDKSGNISESKVLNIKIK